MIIIEIAIFISLKVLDHSKSLYFYICRLFAVLHRDLLVIGDIFLYWTRTNLKPESHFSKPCKIYSSFLSSFFLFFFFSFFFYLRDLMCLRATAKLWYCTFIKEISINLFWFDEIPEKCSRIKLHIS